MNTTESSRFSRFMQEHGLYRAGLGIEGVAEMRKLQAEPEPLRARIRGGSAATSTLKFLGQMIRHGFAELRKDEGLYYLLPAGADWLREVDAVLNAKLSHEEGGKVRYEMEDVTHWMPLPPLPNDQGQLRREDKA